MDEGKYFMIDSGTLLTNRKYQKDLDSVIERAKEAGIVKLIVTGGITLNSVKEALRLTRLYPNVIYCTAGIHPHEAKSWTEETYDQLKEYAMNSECVAIGECGLDYYRNFSEPELQRLVFEKQIQLAIELKKPLFVHERDARDDLIEILSKYKNELPLVLIHCFTGTIETLKAYLEMDFYIGVSGWFCNDKTENGIRKCLIDKQLPLNRIVVETCSPYMLPNTRNNKLPEHVRTSPTENSLNLLNRYCTFQRNEPCSLPILVEMIAAFFNETPHNVALKSTFNALKLFGMT